MKTEKPEQQLESFTSNEDVIKRLKRIEGQIRGIIRMVEEEKECVDILTQVSAVRAATNKVGNVILERYYKKCMTDIANNENPEKSVDELLKNFQRFLSFADK